MRSSQVSDLIWYNFIFITSCWAVKTKSWMLAGRDARELISYQNLLVGFLIKCYHVSLSSFMRLMGSHLVSSATNRQKHPLSKTNYYEFIHLEIPLFHKVKNKNELMSCVEHCHLKLKGLVVLLCKISCTTRWCSKLM